MTHSSFPIRPPEVQGQKKPQASSKHRHFQTAARKFEGQGLAIDKGDWTTDLVYSPFWAGPASQEKLQDSFLRQLQSPQLVRLRGITQYVLFVINKILIPLSELLPHVSQKPRKTGKELSFTNWTLKCPCFLLSLVSYSGIRSLWAGFWLNSTLKSIQNKVWFHEGLNG